MKYLIWNNKRSGDFRTKEPQKDLRKCLFFAANIYLIVFHILSLVGQNDKFLGHLSTYFIKTIEKSHKFNFYPMALKSRLDTSEYFGVSKKLFYFQIGILEIISHS